MKDLFISFANVSIFITCSFPMAQAVSFISDIYEPTDHAEILSSWPRNREFMEISKPEASAGAHAEEALADNAKEIGADAIVIGEAIAIKYSP